MVETGVLMSSATCTSLTPRSINGSTRLPSRTPLTHSPLEMLHVTLQPSVRLGTKTGTCRYKSIGASERLPGCSSGLRCTMPSIAQTSTPPISIQDRAQHSPRLAAPSQPEILSSGSSSSGDGKGFCVFRQTPASLHAPGACRIGAIDPGKRVDVDVWDPCTNS